MTVEELTAAKLKAQTEIMEVLNRFMETSGMRVERVDLIHFNYFGRCKVASVDLDVRL